MSDIIGDSISVLRVKVEVENGFDEVVAENIASLQSDVKSGMFDVNYPYSLVEYLKTNIPKITNIEISGPRSAIAIPLRVIKTFSPENNVSFSTKIGDGGCSRAMVEFLKNWDIIPVTQIASGYDSKVEFKCVSPNGMLRETIIKKSSSKAFKHSFDLQEIEKYYQLNIDTLLLNRPRIGFDKAIDIVRKRENPLISLIIHDYSKYQNATDYLKYVEKSDYVFITAEDSDKSITSQIKKALGVSTYEDIGEAIVNYKTDKSDNTSKRIFLLPPPKDSLGKDKFVSFHQTGMKPVKVEVPDKIRLKMKTAWLNGSCVALARKGWAKCKTKPPFKLSGVLPATQTDFEIFANWAMNMAYWGYPTSNYKPQTNLILK